MLIVGTRAHLEDLDRSGSAYAQDVSVTGVTVGTFFGGVGSLLAGRTRPVWSLLDGQRIVTVGEFDVTPLVRLDRSAQSLAAGAGGTVVVGLEGSHLITVSPEGVVSELSSFDQVQGRDEWTNPAGPAPELRSIAVSDSDVSRFMNVHVGGLWRSNKPRVRRGVGSFPPRAMSTRSSPAPTVLSRSRRRSGSAGARTSVTPGSGPPTACTTPMREPSPSTATQPSSRLRPGRKPTTGAFYHSGSERASSLVRAVAFPGRSHSTWDTGCVAAAHGQVALGTRNGRVFRSRDGGSSWEVAAEGMRPVRVLRFS